MHTATTTRVLAMLAALCLLAIGCADETATADAAETTTPDDAEGSAQDEPSADPTEEATQEPTEEPTEEEPSEEPTDEPTEEPTEEPDDGPSDEPNEPTEPAEEHEPVDPDDLRTLGGAAQVFTHAENQFELEHWLHYTWFENAFRPIDAPNAIWANKGELWDDMVDAVWDAAVEDHADQLVTDEWIWWTEDEETAMPSYGIYPRLIDEIPDDGVLLWAWVAIHPDEGGRYAPDVAVYGVQIDAEETEPRIWHGEVAQVFGGDCVVNGELTWDLADGEITETINACDAFAEVEPRDIDVEVADADDEPAEPAEDSEEPIDDEDLTGPDALRVPGGPAHLFLHAERIFAAAAGDEPVDDGGRNNYYNQTFRPAPHENAMWADKPGLWNEMVDAVWELAVEQHGEQLSDYEGSVWLADEGGAQPSYGINPLPWQSGPDDPLDLFRMWVSIEPADPDAELPDVAVYLVKFDVDEVEPRLWDGQVEQVVGSCVMSGDLPFASNEMDDALLACEGFEELMVSEP